MAETRRKFDADFREGAVRLVRETGKPIAQVARDLGINAVTLGNWVNADARRRGSDGAAGVIVHEVIPGVPLGLAFTCLVAAVPGALAAAPFADTDPAGAPHFLISQRTAISRAGRGVRRVLPGWAACRGRGRPVRCGLAGLCR